MRLFRFDADDDQDILLVNSCDWPGQHETSKPVSTLGLYANDGHGVFSDVTKAAGLDIELYGMGAACGDYDNDGKVDLFISCLGRSRLFHNEGGKFIDVTDLAGVGGDEKDWSSSCGWFDCDQDGDLDLLVCHYVEWTRESDLAQEFRLLGGNETSLWAPQNFGGTFLRCFEMTGTESFQMSPQSQDFMLSIQRLRFRLPNRLDSCSKILTATANWIV